MSADPKQAGEIEGVISQLALVEYQPGAVVSRTIIKKAAGTITAFAFDAGEGLSEHTAPYDALVLGVDGMGGLRGVRVRLADGTTARELLPPEPVVRP